MRITLEHDEVGELPRGDRSLQVFLRRRVGAVDGRDRQRLVDGNLLGRAPDATLVVLPRDPTTESTTWPMLAELQRNGVDILKGPESDENGKFAWILDPDGNKVELWEPMPWDENNKAT